MLLHVINVQHLTKRYGTRTVVDDLSFEAAAGEVTGYLGPNGAGKTTTFRMMLGLAQPSAGTALINGRPYRNLTDPRSTVGALLESSGFHPSRTGRDHLRVNAAAAGIGTRRVDELLALVGLAAAAGRRVGGYSLGMRQRLSLATALLGDPHVLVLDEPTNGLDPEGVAWLRGLMRGWAAEGRCVLVSSHLLAEVAQAVDHIVIVKDGRVVHQARADANRGAEVAVRSADPGSLSSVLARSGWQSRVDPSDPALLHVADATTEQVGLAAASAGIAVLSLSARPAAEALEEMFLTLTSDGPGRGVAA